MACSLSSQYSSGNPSCLQNSIYSWSSCLVPNYVFPYFIVVSGDEKPAPEPWLAVGRVHEAPALLVLVAQWATLLGRLWLESAAHLVKRHGLCGKAVVRRLQIVNHVAQALAEAKFFAEI